jgi:hypothetical protein
MAHGGSYHGQFATNENVAKDDDRVLGKRDRKTGMSDTAFYQGMMRDAFPARRYGSAKAALYEAHRFISRRVSKDFTPRRARSIWEGTAARIDAEEADALRAAEIEGARREYKELQDRLAFLETSLAMADEAFHGPKMATHRAFARGLGGVDRAGIGKDG